MLPPPTTTAGWIPRSTISASCRATNPIASSEMPEPEVGANASPESLSKTRWYAGRASPSLMRPSLLRVLAQLEPDEAPDLNLLTGLGADFVKVLLDRLGVVLHVRLVEQHVVLQERLDLAFDDPGHDVVGLGGLLGLRLRDALFGLQDLGRHIVAAEPPRGGGARGGQGQILDQLAEFVGVGHEIGLAIYLHQHTDRVVEVDVGVDQALVGAAARALGHACETLLTKDLGGALDVAVGFDQRTLAVHHPGAGGVAQGLDHLGGDVRHG